MDCPVDAAGTLTGEASTVCPAVTSPYIPTFHPFSLSLAAAAPARYTSEEGDHIFGVVCLFVYFFVWLSMFTFVLYQNLYKNGSTYSNQTRMRKLIYEHRKLINL